MMAAKEVIKNGYDDRHKFSGTAVFFARLNRGKSHKFARPAFRNRQATQSSFFGES
jgi:hypothetical protein